MGARGGKARLESDHAVFRRFRAGQIYCRTPYSTTREHPQSSGSARDARPASNWILRFSPAQCAEHSFCRAPYSTQGNIHRAAGVLEGARPTSNQIMRFFRRNAPDKASAALRIPHKGTSTEQRECSRGQGPPRLGFCGFLRHSPEKTAPELLAPGRPRSYGNGGCSTHMTARC